MPPHDAEATMARKPVWGIHQGIVEETIDPDRLGRLKVRVPSVLGNTAARWARPCVAEPNRSAATFTPPDAGTPVWIQFEGGDTSRPVWLGFPLTR
jgi:type VI secretion system (T6SS) baseplate-like injector VgrG